MKDCDSVIQWYNEVICWLADVVTDAQLQQLSWPVIEFSHSGNSGLYFVAYTSSAVTLLLSLFVRCLQ